MSPAPRRRESGLRDDSDLVRIDHVNLASIDFEATARRLRERLGLGVEPFPGRTGGHVPLAGRQYIEIHTPASPSFEQFISRVARNGDRWWAWSVAVEQLPPHLARATFDSRDGSAFTPWSGEHAGAVESAPSRGLLPYFIRYDTEELDDVFNAKRAVAEHRVEVGAITELVVGPDQERLDDWLGRRLPEVRVDGSVIGVAGVTIEVDGAEVIVPLA